MSDLPQPTSEQLAAHHRLASDLHQWAPTVHQLVRERIAALMAAYGPRNHSTETDEEFAQRVLAHGQYPPPVGEYIYDDDSLSSNRGYDHIHVGYGPEHTITYSGWYPQWAPDGESYERRWTQISCPGWLVTDPDGIERYRTETEQMAQVVREERAAEDARIHALLEQVRSEHCVDRRA